MRYVQTTILALTALLVMLFTSCKNRQGRPRQNPDTLISNTKEMDSDLKLAQPLQVGDKIELSGGYDYEPLYLANPPAAKRTGKVIRFIKGQNESPAAVVKLNESISGKKTTGDIVILELRHVGQTWSEPTPVHIELCDFMPDDKPWKDRKQGEWIEAAATVTLMQTKE